MNGIKRFGMLAGLLAVLAFAASPAGAEGGDETPASKEGASATEPEAQSGHEHHGRGAVEPAKPAPSKGPREKGTVTTITGEVMDPACFLEAGVKSIGPGHFQCAVDCARSGQTLAIYDRAADRIYFIAGELPGRNPNDPVIQYIHKKVDVTGTVYHRAGVYGIVIVKVEPHKPAAAGAASAPNGATR